MIHKGRMGRKRTLKLKKKNTINEI